MFAKHNRQKKQIKPFIKIAILLKDWTKIVVIKTARCAQNKTKITTYQIKAKQNQNQSQNKRLLINDCGFSDKILCSYSLEIVTYV